MMDRVGKVCLAIGHIQQHPSNLLDAAAMRPLRARTYHSPWMMYSYTSCPSCNRFVLQKQVFVTLENNIPTC